MRIRGVGVRRARERAPWPALSYYTVGMTFSLMPARLFARPSFRTLSTVFSYVFVMVLVAGALWRMTVWSPGAVLTGGAALMPWQMLILVIAGMLMVALVMRKIRVRAAWDFLVGITLFLGVWYYCWMVFGGEPGLVVASLATLVQAWVRRVWVHILFMLTGVAGMSLYVAFSFSLQTLIMLLVIPIFYDIFARRDEGASQHSVASLVHRGVIPGIVVPENLQGFQHDVLHEMRMPQAMLLGSVELVLPMVLTARAFGAHALSGALVAAGTIVAAVWLTTRGSRPMHSPLLPLAIGSGVPFIVLSLFHLV